MFQSHAIITDVLQEMNYIILLRIIEFSPFTGTTDIQHWTISHSQDCNRIKFKSTSRQGWQRAERAEHEVFPLLVYEQKGILLAHKTSRAEQRPHPARSYGERVARSARSARLVGYMSSLELYVNEYFALESMN